MRAKLSALAKKLAGDMVGRDLIALPHSKTRHFSGSKSNLLPIRYDYRASEQGTVTYRTVQTGTDLRFQLFSMAFEGQRPVPGQELLSFDLPKLSVGDVLRVSLLDPLTWLNDHPIKCASPSSERTRKFIAELRLSDGARILTRRCSHYLPFNHKPVGKDYYFGDDYVDYPKYTDPTGVLRLVRRYCDKGRLLDVSCALGVYTKAFETAGFDAHGIDISEYAVAEAEKSLGTGSVRQCNLDSAEIPFDGEFDILWMWDVLEHFSDPWKALQKVTDKSHDGTWLFLHTSNSDSLTHRIFGTDWEGYTDYSHFGVDKVTATSLRQWLTDLGWQVIEWDCSGVWLEGDDPVVMRLRDSFQRIPEMATLLSERSLGDTLSVVARKREGVQRPTGLQ